MDISILKKSIESSMPTQNFIIFKNTDNSFLSNQYTNAIASKTNCTIEYIESLDGLYVNDPFLDPELSTLYVYHTDTLQNLKSGLDTKNLIIICNKIDKASSQLYKDFIIDVPKVELWQVKDFIFSVASGLSETQLESLYNMCQSNIYRAALELDKLCIFTESERSIIFDSYVRDNQYSDLNQDTIFTLCNAIISKDILTICKVYKEIDTLDFNVFGFIQLLYTNFKNIINVQLAKYPTAESCGLKPNQFYAIKYKVGIYTREQLIKIFSMLTGLDKQIKVGQISTDIVLDYIITYILNI